MATFTNGFYLLQQKMTMPERIALTCAMRDSGMVIDWSHMILMARYVDKLYWWCW
ncbi:hypothetical protein OH492_04820 [Vibrio chagasii]|nr:hypothetical protein [Vibrio chagasii]